jgi:hypothetical protein
VHTSPAQLGDGACDHTAPSVRLRPAWRGAIKLATLRRGLRIDVREPSAVEVSTFYDDGDGGAVDVGRHLVKVLAGVHGGTVTYRLPAARLRRYERRLAAGRRPKLSFYVAVSDREGNIRNAGGGGRRVTR